MLLHCSHTVSSTEIVCVQFLIILGRRPGIPLIILVANKKQNLFLYEEYLNAWVQIQFTRIIQLQCF